MPCPSDREPVGRNRDKRWRNFIQSVDITVGSYWEPHRHPAPPDSVKDLVWIVRQAEAEGKRVHAVGAGYSFEDIAATNDWMIDLKNLSRRISGVVDDTSAHSPLTDTWRLRQAGGGDGAPFRLVHAEAGIRLFDLCTELAREGLGPLSVGGALGQTLAGATQTSTHGSEPNIGPLCDQIQAVHLVAAGGQEYWVERHSAPVTHDDEALRRAISACGDLRIVRNDALFNSVIVSGGRCGIIYSMIFMVISALRVAEFGVSLSTAEVVRNLPVEPQGEYGYFSAVEAMLSNPPPSLRAGIRDVASWRYFDIIMNSRRPQQCIVRRRWETSAREDLKLKDDQGFLCDHGVANGIALAAQGALSVFATTVAPIPFVGQAKAVQAGAKATELLALAANPHVTGGEVLAKTLNAMWEVQFESMLEEPINKVTDFAWDEETKDSRETGKVGLLWQVAAGKQDPVSIGTCYRGNSIEIIFRARSRGFKEFVNSLVEEAPRHRQAGYIAIRFTRASDALLSMHYQSGDRKEIFCAIEVTSLAGLQGNDAWFRWVEQTALRLGGRPHWGQQNTLSEERVRTLYSETLESWKEECAFVSGSSKTFSNAYTSQRGLEPNPSPGFGWRYVAHASNCVAMTAVEGGMFPGLVAATEDGKLWVRAAMTRETPWTQIGPAANVVAMAAVDGELFAATTDNKLLARDSVSRDVPWTNVGHADNCVAMAAVGRTLFAATRDNKLWARDAVRRDIAWTHIGHANGCVGMTAVEGGMFPGLVAAARDGKLWVRAAMMRETSWTQIGPAEGVVAMATVAGKLFAATEDDRLWVRDFS